ncbi:MAG: HAD-IC family P-type ATPase, partial [Candidatus Babeliales bacterium]
MKTFQLSKEELLKKYTTNDQTGLTDIEAAARLITYGPNSLPRSKKENIVIMFLRQFKNPLIYILLIAAAMIFALGQHMDAFILSGILFFNAIIGTIQEGRTANILESLQKFITQESMVIRNDKKQIVPSSNLVPGDIILLQEGDKIPADARLIEAHNLITQEAVLTGESQGVQKISKPIDQDSAAHDQINMLFSGTYVLQGIGKAVVVATGLATEMGKIHQAIEHVTTETPLKQSIEHLSRWIIVIILGMTITLFIIGLIQQKPLIDLMTMLAALFICVIPEGLPVVLTLVLVSGAYRMAQQNMLVKNLPAVEALGRIDVIVIDKTGTLTRNEMMVEEVYADDTLYTVSGRGYFIEGHATTANKKITDATQEKSLYQMGIAAALLNHSEITYDQESKQFNVTGDPTEAATYIFSQKIGITPQEIAPYKPLFEIPFNSDLRYHATFFSKNGKGILYVIGSPETVLQKSNTLPAPAQAAFDQFLSHGLRVLAVASKEFNLQDISYANGDPIKFFSEKITQLNFLGFFAIQDAIRDSVAEIVQTTRQAGVHIILVTGDHAQTALYVAKQTGIYKEGDHVLDGPEFRLLTNEQLVREIDHVTVFSRILPQEKMRIIQAIHQRGQKVAMTGDGVNDAPALVAADVGIAMGGIGTEVAKQAADVILLDDSFTSITRGIAEGRHIFDTLRRTILYFFTTNMAEVLIVLFALVANLPIPLVAAQILWLNFITDGFLDTALSTEPPQQNLLTKQ